MLTKIPIPYRLSLTYLIFGCFWIFASGSIARRLAGSNINLLNQIEEIKGSLFVIISAILIFLISLVPYRRLVSLIEDYRLVIKKNKAIHTASREGIYEFDVCQDKVILNENLSRVVGDATIEPSTARIMWERGIHPDQRNSIIEAFDTAEREGREYWREEYLFKVNGEGYKNILHSVYFVKGEDGKVHSIVGAVQDLTRHRQLEREFHEHQLLLKTQLSRTIIETEERERNRWSEELHDNIAQVLSVATLYCGMLKNKTHDFEESVDRVKEMIDMGIKEIRQLSANLKPPRFEKGLKEAIETLIFYIKRINQQTEFHITCAYEDRMTEEQKLMAYRIIQEQIHNTVKYAEANNVWICLNVESGRCKIDITDDGKGFDKSKMQQGIGLKNIRSRLEVFRGEYDIETSPGCGVKLHAEFDV